MPRKSTTIADEITAAQCRAARALLGITQSELAAMAALGLSTIVDFEKQRRPISKAGLAAIRRGLEKAGISFSRGGVSVDRPWLTGCHDIASFSDHVVDFSPRELSGSQVRAARALLRWRVEDLARATALGVNTIRRVETDEEGKSITRANRIAIRRALEAAGIAFIDENGGGPGVRLRERRPP
jgi:transcriptional regulator with XRE-family HTH domain